MFDRETILPLTLGLIVALLVHLAAGAAVEQWRLTDRPNDARLPDSDSDRQQANDEPQLDLAAEVIDVAEPRIAGQPARITLQIANRGDAAAPPFAYTLSLDDQVIHRGRTDTPLESGDVLDDQIEHTVESPGTHRLTLHADPARELTEPIRDNNRLTATFFWDVAPADRPEGVDLAIAELRIGQPRIVGAPVTVSGRLVNLGRSDAGVFNLTLLVDGEPLEEQTLDGLASGESDRFVTRIYIDEPGEHTVTLAADIGQVTADLDRENNALSRSAEWLTEQEMERPMVGQRDPSPLKINWISYEDYEELVAREAEFDQAAVQPHAEPVPNAPTPQDPTPPAPPEQSQAITPPPALQVSPQPQPSERMTEAEPSPEPPSQPTVPREITDRESTAPALELESESAAAPAEAEAALPDPPDVAERDATETQPVTDTTEAEQPVPATPAEAAPSREIAIATLDVPTTDDPADADLLLPEVSEEEAEEMIDRRAPVAEVEDDADPTDRSLQVRVDELLDRREVTLPLEPDADAEPGSPQQEETDAAAEDRTTQTADRPVDPSQPLRDGARPEQPQAEPTSPTEQQPSEAQPSEESTPTSAPRDEREAPPVSRLSDLRVQPGRVIARQGIEIRTVEPRFSDIARRTSLPRNPDVLLTFNTDGEVLHARVIRSTGYANIDGPVLASLYRWTAHGELLEEVDDTFTLRVRILFNVIPDDEDEEDEEDEAEGDDGDAGQ